MGTINPTITEVGNPGEGQAYIVVWTPMLNGDVGAPFDLPNYFDRSIQLEGTFGSGGSCALEGSNDSTNFHSLTDPQGVAIAITSASLKAVTEVARKVRPHVTAGDGSTSLTATMYVRRTKQP